MQNNWKTIQDIYKLLFQIPPKVVDYLAVEPIFKLLSKGYSNSRISLELDEDEDYIKATIQEFLGFSGYKQDLDFDPSAIFNRHRFNKYMYSSEVKRISPLSTDEEILASYKVNELLDQMERMITYYVK